MRTTTISTLLVMLIGCDTGPSAGNLSTEVADLRGRLEALESKEDLAKGDQGERGLPGKDGADGMVGEPGPACWDEPSIGDLDGSGVQDYDDCILYLGQQLGIATLTTRVQALEGAGFLDAAGVQGILPNNIVTSPTGTNVDADALASALDTRVQALEDAGHLDATGVEALLPQNIVTSPSGGNVNADTLTSTLGTCVQIADLDSELTARRVAISANGSNTNIDSLAANVASLGDVSTVVDGRVGTLEGQLGSLQVVDTQMVINVSTAAELETEIAALANLIILPTATVTILLGDGTYTMSGPLQIDHPNGGRVQILGSNAAFATLSFTDSDGIFADNGQTVGLVDGVTILGDKTGTHYGALAVNGATINLGGGTKVTGFADGVRAEKGGTITAHGVVAFDNTGQGFSALDGGTIQADGSQAINNGQYGYLAERGGFLEAVDSTSTGSGGSGYQSQQGSVMVITNAMSNSNQEHGISAIGAFVGAAYATSDSNGWSGFSSDIGGRILADYSLADSNIVHGFASRTRSLIYATYAASTNNNQVGVYTDWGGVTAFFYPTSVYGNGTDYNPLNTTVSTVDAYTFQ